MKKIQLYLLALLLFVGCTPENDDACKPTHEKKADVLFEILVSGQNQFADIKEITKSLDVTAEKSLYRIDILAFKIEDGKELFAYHTKAEAIINTEAPDVKKVTAKLLLSQDNTQYRFILLANLPDEQGNALSATPENTQKDQLLSNILFSNPDLWIADEPTLGRYTPFPMWGESKPVIVNSDVVLDGIDGIELARMVAKFDIVLTSQEAIDIFKMEEVHLYNRKTRGNVVPTPSKWVNSEATGATIPPDDNPEKPLTIKGPGIYSQGVESIGITNSIYTFEAEAPAKDAYSDATCFVIGGKYGTDQTTSYYRVDLMSLNGEDFKDILRNHYYKINITRILSRGYNSSEDAFNSISTNIITDIQVWDMNKLVNSASDGQFILNVSKDLFEFSKDSRSEADADNKLTIYTDYPGGWSISKITDEEENPISWLSFSGSEQSGLENEEKTVSIHADYNDTKTIRTGHIYVTAGRISYKIVVHQDNTDIIDISIKDRFYVDISELFFPSNPGQAQSSISAQSFIVRWKPFVGGNPCRYTTNIIGDLPFDYGDGASIPTMGMIANPVGAMDYFNIRPKPFTLEEVAEDGTGNPFLEKTSRIDFIVSNGINSKSKSIILNQTNYTVVANTDPFYLMNGMPAYITLRSNSSWKISVMSDPDNLIESITSTTGGYDTEIGDRVNFTLKDKRNSLEIIESHIALYVECTDPHRYFPPKVIMLNCFNGEEVPASNCYIVKPDAMPILIPVTQYQKTFSMQDGILPVDWIQPNDIIDAKLLWTDNPNGVKRNSSVRAYVGVGKGNQGYIFVAPGSTEGNAIIAVSVNGEIRWSWHIWITNYSPGDGTAAGEEVGTYFVEGGSIYRFINSDATRNSVIMDRNLGATSANEGDVKTQGLLYQWGRKDPFPAKGNWIDDTQEPQIYNEDIGFTIQKMSSASTGTGGANIFYSVNHPDIFLYAAGNWTTRFDNLWWKFGDSPAVNYKTAYDPCPYGWAVPTTNTYNGLQFTSGNDFEVANGVNGIIPVGPSAAMGFLPYSGARNGTTGNFANVGVNANTWTFQPSGGDATSIFYGTTTFTSLSLIRASGLTVRCVKNNGAE